MANPGKPLRADAERNRQAIICAAGAVFATEGTAVTLERIANKAKVGVGTIYRRFSSIDELVVVVLEEKMRRYADRAELAAAQASSEPWEAFRDWVLYMLEEQANDLAFSDVILTSTANSELFLVELRRTVRSSMQLVRQVRAAGAIRPDFVHSDLLMLQHANAGLVRGAQHEAPDAWKRLASYMLQSFRVGADPLTPPPQTWSRG